MANPWNLLRSILPQDARQVGSIQSVNADGTSDVLMVGGGVVRVSASGYSVGHAVFVQSGQVVSTAPSLSVIQIDV